VFATSLWIDIVIFVLVFMVKGHGCGAFAGSRVVGVAKMTRPTRCWRMRTTGDQRCGATLLRFEKRRWRNVGYSEIVNRYCWMSGREENGESVLLDERPRGKRRVATVGAATDAEGSSWKRGAAGSRGYAASSSLGPVRPRGFGELVQRRSLFSFLCLDLN
jgi:hypothetical protein